MSTYQFASFGARSREHSLSWRSAWLTVACAALVACGGGGGGGGDDGGGNPQTGTLEATVVDEFGAPVAGALVEATVGSTTRTDTTDDAGVATVTNVPTGSASVEVSLETFATFTGTATINANATTSIDVTLQRNTQAAGGVLTTEVIGTPTENGRVLTFELQVVVVDGASNAIENLTTGDFDLPDCALPDPDPSSFQSTCIRFPDNSQLDRPYTVDNATADAFALVPGLPEEDYAAALMLDQSGSVNSTDPTGARLFSAKAFVQTVDAGSGDSVLLAAFADDNETQTALIPEKPLWIANEVDPFTTDGESFFDELETLRSQAAGGTPLYRTLFPEPTDTNDDPAFTVGLIDVVEANAPSGLRRAIVLFTDGEDSECGGPNVCRAKRDSVIDHANAADVNLFTIGLSEEVDFEALGELARGTDGVFLFAENAEQLIPLYGSLGALLSRSLPTYRMRWTVRSDTDGTFASGRSVLGRLQIDAGGTAIQVPFIVGVP
jgi:hypothetical protein